MFISKINKNYFMNAPHQKESGFGSSQKREQILESKSSFANSTFVNLSDKDLYRAASILPNERFNKVRDNVAGTLFVGIPVFDTLAAGFVKSGGLSSKIKQMAKRTGLWGFVFATGISLGLLKHNVNKNSIVLDNIDKNHPVMRFGMDATFITGAMYAAYAIKDKASSYIKNKYGESIKKAQAPIKRVLNNTILNKKVLVPIDNALTKLAKGNRTPLNIAAMYVAPTLATAAFIRYFAESKARKENIQTNFSALKSFQTALKEHDRKNI